jgi:6-phosphogluconolactonase
MNVEILENVDTAAARAAKIIAEEANKAIAERGRFVFAVSGGHAPWLMLRALANEDVPWASVHLLQVDERVAIAGNLDRNLTHLQTSFLDHVSVKPQLHAMPVEAEDLQAAAAEYAATLRQIAGSPPVLDLVHLGLGFDGHTASLVPGDAVLNVADRDVAITDFYQDRQRMTLTYPVINRARKILWVVIGEEKAGVLKRLMDGDVAIPAGRIQREQAVVIADQDAAGRRKAA